MDDFEIRRDGRHTILQAASFRGRGRRTFQKSREALSRNFKICSLFARAFTSERAFSEQLNGSLWVGVLGSNVMGYHVFDVI